jgi:hypothetical protein
MLLRPHRRDPYVQRLARSALFHDVPLHLQPMLGRSVDEVVLAAGASLSCSPARAVFAVLQGVGVVHPEGRAAQSIAPPGTVLEAAPRVLRQTITAVTPLRLAVIARREVEALARIAPAFAAALADARQHDVSVTRELAAPRVRLRAVSPA